MDFRINCPCGNHLLVTEGSAGATLRCSCGRVIPVPTLKELRIMAGLPAYEVSPELEIEQLLASEQVPCAGSCVECGTETDQIIHVVTECERSWTGPAGGSSWANSLLSVLFLPFWARLWQGWDERRYGTDKVYRLPLPVCKPCQRALRNERAIKQSLCKIPEYDRLLKKFPDAVVSV